MAGSSALGERPGLASSRIVARVVTAGVGIPLVVIVVVVGGPLYVAIVAAAGCVAAWEACRILAGRGHRPAIPLVLAMSALFAIVPSVPHAHAWWQATLLLGLIAAGAWFLFSPRAYDGVVDWLLTVGIAVYAGGLLGSLVGVRQLHHGLGLALLALILTWAYDTGAYFAGRLLGRTPFMGRLSPSKTWEGVAGGLALAVAAALVASSPVGISLVTGLAVALAISAAAQTGDLVESLLKRYGGVKDSGNLIPGHGGLLDRIDGLLFAGTAAYYVLLLAGVR